ncbi:DUF4926 domain-containing protein [Ectopseudomonas mendocina]|uniref:DUF4926 domain-containing protein n=2 Tax=Ectopseudomonas mendocina TaxID=300 RepID=B3SPW4_ECTME|nr:DUF4926 domain-containing protein [Pseudomonas mendocina]ABV54368.1 hypothetical protein [Pseudomonas mendocina]
MKPYDVVQVIALRDERFSKSNAGYERNPCIGDIGTIIDVYSNPEPAFEVECSDSNGITIWLAAMYPEELKLSGQS